MSVYSISMVKDNKINQSISEIAKQRNKKNDFSNYLHLQNILLIISQINKSTLKLSNNYNK